MVILVFMVIYRSPDMINVHKLNVKSKTTCHHTDEGKKAEMCCFNLLVTTAKTLQY